MIGRSTVPIEDGDLTLESFCRPQRVKIFQAGECGVPSDVASQNILAAHPSTGL
jgi:hypothetical protein